MWERFYVTGQNAMAAGRWADAERDFKNALVHAEALGQEDHRLPLTLNNLANCYRQQGRFEEAEPLYKRALTVKTSQVGPVSYDLIPILENYAKMLRGAGRDEEAEKMDYKALVIFSRK
ncbi:MAG TPA: tetratricopeptide repeat protein [Planktothrix sp.]|jgi:tetratricopeptide (TPR) repeat protein